MDLLSEYALCLGVGVCRNNKLPNVHLLRLDDPHLALTRSWYPGEQFEAGKWYRKDHHQKRLYKLADDIVKTIAVRTMDLNAAVGQNTFELILPVYFVPDFTISGGIDLDGKLPMLKDPEKAAVPVCPLFGPEGIEVLPPVKWSNGGGSNNIYSNALYSLKINISYTSGDSPVWTPQSVGQLKPWNYEQYPIVSQLCRENRTEGIVINQVIMGRFETGRMQYCLITDKQAQLSIGVFPESEAKAVSDKLQFWPIQLDFYEFPLVLALGCPQEGNNSQSIIQHFRPQFIAKCASNEFKFKVEKKNLEKLSQDVYHIEWLGKIIDPFHCVDDKLFQSIKTENLLEIHAQPQWCLKKRSVCWIFIGDIKECSNTSSNLPEMNSTHQQKTDTSDQVIQSADKLRTISSNSEGNSDKSTGTSSSLPPISSSSNTSLIKKKAIAAFMTIRAEGGEPVFLFWDVNTEKFNRKCHAEFHPNITFPWVPGDFGKWYELTYSDIPSNEMRIIVLDYRKTEQRAVTRVRDEICAQFSTNQHRYVNAWHAKYPCKAKNFCEDEGWWPWLCRTCSPDLRDLSPPPVVLELSTTPGTSKSLGIPNKKVLSPSLEELAAKMQNSLALEEENIDDYPPDIQTISALPVKKTKQADVKQQSQQLANVSKQKSASVCQFPVNYTMQTALAVLLTVRENMDSVFLIFSEEQNKFTHRVYAEPPKKINGKPAIGNWYKLNYKLNSSVLQTGQKITVVNALVYNSKEPVTTRVHNQVIAQFNSKQKFVNVWHRQIEKMHKYKVAEPSSPWWPQLCLTCYPTTNDGLEPNKAQVKEAGKSSKRQYTTVAPGMEEEYTDSEPDTESCVTGEVGDDLSSWDGSDEEESPNITPTGSPKPNPIASVNYLVQSQFPDLAERPFNGFSMTKLADISNSPAESIKIQQNGNELDANGPSTTSAPQLDGSFGSARLRRLQLAKSASSSRPPRGSAGGGSK